MFLDSIVCNTFNNFSVFSFIYIYNTVFFFYPKISTLKILSSFNYREFIILQSHMVNKG